MSSEADEWEVVTDPETPEALSPGVSDDEVSIEAVSVFADSTGERQKVWWAGLLHKHATALGLQIPIVSAPISLLSGCSGSLAEGFVLEDRAGPGPGDRATTRYKLL